MKSFKQFIAEMVRVTRSQATRRLQHWRTPDDTGGVIYPKGKHSKSIRLPHARSNKYVSKAWNTDDRNLQWQHEKHEDEVRNGMKSGKLSDDDVKRKLTHAYSASLVAKRRGLKPRRLSEVLGVKPGELRQSMSHSHELDPSQHLHTSQPKTYATDDSKLYAKTDTVTGHRHIRITSYTDEGGTRRHAIADGHHALMGHLARGHDPVVIHHDLDAETEELHKTAPHLHSPVGDFPYGHEGYSDSDEH